MLRCQASATALDVFYLDVFYKVANVKFTVLEEHQEHSGVASDLYDPVDHAIPALTVSFRSWLSQPPSCATS